MIDLLSQQLSALNAGDRAWFWLGKVNSEPSLYISSVRSDPRMERLNLRLNGIGIAERSEGVSGLLSFGSDGVAKFGSESTTSASMELLLSIVNDNAENHPSVGLLTHARMVSFSSSGEITGHFDSDKWNNANAVTLPGSVAETAAYLENLTDESEYWFVLTESGDGGRPFLTITSKEHDTGDAITHRYTLLRNLAPATKMVVLGVMKQSNGTINLVSSDADPSNGPAALKTFVSNWKDRYPVLLKLKEHRFAWFRNGQFAKLGSGAGVSAKKTSASSKKKASSDLTSQTGVLNQIESTPAFFVAHVDSANNVTMLFNQDRKVLGAAAKGLGDGKTLKGRMRWTSKGCVEFSATKTLPNFIKTLAGWVEAHIEGEKTLGKLKNSRFIAKDADGNVIDRQKDGAVWNFIK